MKKILHRTIPLPILAAIICRAAVSAHAANSVAIESKMVYQGDTAINVGIFVENDVPITFFLLPFEFRSLSDGSYIRDQMRLRLSSTGRIAKDLFGNNGCPIECLFLNKYAVPSGSSCSGPISNSYQVPAASVDFQSPDAVRLYGYFIDEGRSIGAGADPPNTDSASLFFTLNVSSVPGQFIIDTCCVVPAEHLLFTDTLYRPVVPSFTPGLITILPCECPCLADPHCDSLGPDMLDIVATINAAFNNSGQPQDQVCPKFRTDFDCNDYTDAVDVVRLIEVALRGGPMWAWLNCHPCPMP